MLITIYSSNRRALTTKPKPKTLNPKPHLQELDGLVVDLLLGEVHERAQEAHVAHHVDTVLVAAGHHLLTLLVLVLHLVQRLLLQNQDRVEDALYNVRGLLQLLQSADVLGGDGGKRCDGLLERGFGGRKVLQEGFSEGLDTFPGITEFQKFQVC